jgi:hypothetical protein
MATSERSLTIPETSEDALRKCTRVLVAAGFKKVEANHPAMMVSGQKRSFGQWTKNQVTIIIEPTDAGSTVTVSANATAQSLSSLASSPADRMVNQVVDALSAS